MQIQSKIFEIKNTGDFSVEYIEAQLKNLYMIIPLRWAIVEINKESISINTAFEKTIS